MSGLDLEDAERATEIVISRASDPVERRIAFASAYSLAMNRGRPRQAAEYLRRRAMIQDDPLSFWTWGAMAALFWEGDSALAEAVVRDRRARIVADTLGIPAYGDLPGPVDVARHLAQQGMWDFIRGDTARASAAVHWLRRHEHPLGADFIDVLIASGESGPMPRCFADASTPSRSRAAAPPRLCTGPIWWRRWRMRRQETILLPFAP